MTHTRVQAATSTVAAVIGRGFWFTAAAGIVVGGVVSSFDWPVVATFFGALTGLTAGIGTGVLDGVVLALIGRYTVSSWAARSASRAARSASATVWAAGAVAAKFTLGGSLAAWVAVVAVCAGAGGAVGPSIMRGVEPVRWRRTKRPVELSQLASGLLAWGAGGGGVLGGLVGVVLGVREPWTIAPFAVVEGAVLGAVSGVVVTLTVGAVVFLPRMHARR